MQDDVLRIPRCKGYILGMVNYLHQSVGGLDTVELCLKDCVLHRVVSRRRDVGDGAHALGRQHDLVLRDQIVFADVAVDVATAHVGPDPGSKAIVNNRSAA